LSVAPHAFIRPSPTSGALGGVAEHTREAMLLCEAAGYDIVIVETVGVGQSESAVAGMTDLFVLMQLPNAGDDLQAIKRGVMELADLVVVNKADLDDAAATRAQAQITGAVRAPVSRLSALKGEGIETFWQAVLAEAGRRRASGEFDQRRRSQALAWMWDNIHAELKHRFDQHPAVRSALARTAADVGAGRLAPSTASRQLMALFTAP
jgi:LAO/AO transport system kinase